MTGLVSTVSFGERTSGGYAQIGRAQHVGKVVDIPARHVDVTDGHRVVHRAVSRLHTVTQLPSTGLNRLQPSACGTSTVSSTSSTDAKTMDEDFNFHDSNGQSDQHVDDVDGADRAQPTNRPLAAQRGAGATMTGTADGAASGAMTMLQGDVR